MSIEKQRTFILAFSFPPLLPCQLDRENPPTFNLPHQAIIIPIKIQGPQFPLSFLIPAVATAVFSFCPS
jgi:hypothetical protein